MSTWGNDGFKLKRIIELFIQKKGNKEYKKIDKQIGLIDRLRKKIDEE
jgi:hypothetical protein